MFDADSAEFDPAAGTGAAMAEFYMQLADAAAELGEDELADDFWQLGAKAAHPTS